MSPLLQVALLLTAVALPGLVLRRRASWLPRVCALLAALGVVYAVWDRPHREARTVPAHVAVVPTAPVSAADRAMLHALVGDGATLSVAAADADPGDRLAGSRLARRREPELLLVHNGRFVVRPGAAVAPHGAQVVHRLPVLPIDPDAVRVRLAATARVGRPAVVEVLLGDAAPATGIAGELAIAAPDGSIVSRTQLAGDAIERIEWRPAVAGTHTVRLRLAVRAGATVTELRGVGALEVGAPAPVTIVGAAAGTLAKALAVQGVEVRVRPALPASLADVGTLLLMEPLAVAEQARVRRFLEDGGGVFLVGAKDGGAVPLPTEPLGALSPVIRLPPAAPTGDPGGATGKTTAPDPRPKEPDPKPKEPPRRDPETTPATGDTTAARLKIKEMDVHRRKIAMVLIVDRSGSMSEEVARDVAGRPVTKMDLAKASALHTAAALDDGDLLGVISFGATAIVVLPLSPVQNRGRIRQRLESLRAARETTHVAAALDAARAMLVGSKAAVKHAVIISDGVIHDTGPHYTGGLSAARRFQTEKTGITLSLVQAVPLAKMEVGTGTQSRQLTEMGNGLPAGAKNRYYIQQESFEAVPKVLSAEVRALRSQAGRPADKSDPGEAAPGEDPLRPKVEDQPRPKQPEKQPEKQPDPGPAEPKPAALAVRAIEDSHLLEPRPDGGFPSLAGILPVEVRRDAVTLLVAGEAGTPLLAFANRGLGRVGVFTADFLGEWGSGFAAGAGFPARLAQWVRHLAPSETVLHGVDVVTSPAVAGGTPLPREVARLERLGGAAMQPIGEFVVPPPHVEVTVQHRAERDAIYGLLLVVLLALTECLWWRRGRG